MTRTERIEKRIAAFDRPLIWLALLAVALYLAELFRAVPGPWCGPAFWFSCAVDFVFLVDFVAKCVVLRGSYVRSPWFVVDLISTLPAIGSFLEAYLRVGSHLRFLSAVRVARVARLGRVMRLAKIGRVARLARVLRVAQGLRFLRSPSAALQQTPSFDSALRIGVPVLLLAFMGLSLRLEQVEVASLQAELRERVGRARDLREIQRMPEHLGPTQLTLVRSATFSRDFGRGPQELRLSLDAAVRRAERVQGLILLFGLLTVGAMAYLGNRLSRDRVRGTEAALLEQCFSPPIVGTFFTHPEILDRYYQQWMSVFFIDVCGFTAATEKFGDDLESLALRLRRVMDIARQEIVVSYHGVVDKFMGDAVMGWIGGHLSKHWEVLAGARRELLMDERESLAGDVTCLGRKLSELEDERRAAAPSDVKRIEEQRREISAALAQARAELAEVRKRQDALVLSSPEVMRRYEETFAEYRRTVARAAVLCLLRIAETVRTQPEPEAFRHLKMGLASGPVCLGNFGSTQQVGFTVLGPTVNRAARLEPASFQCGCQLLVDQETFELVGDDQEIVFRRWGKIQVKGIEGELAVYEPLHASEEVRSFLELYHQGCQHAEAGKLQHAMDLFEQADHRRAGGDPASQRRLEALKLALAEGRESLGAYRASKG